MVLPYPVLHGVLLFDSVETDCCVDIAESARWFLVVRVSQRVLKRKPSLAYKLVFPHLFVGR